MEAACKPSEAQCIDPKASSASLMESETFSGGWPKTNIPRNFYESIPRIDKFSCDVLQVHSGKFWNTIQMHKSSILIDYVL